jgi:hypothetical protein
MRATISKILFFVMIVVAMVAASCAKEFTAPTQSVYPVPVDTSGTITSGSIRDLGPVSQDVRKMAVTYVYLVNDIDNYTGNLVPIGIQLKFDFYTHDDDFITPGKYTYVPSGANSTFMISNGSVLIPGRTIYDQADSLSVIDGFVNVTRNADQYKFSFTIELDTGNILTGTTSSKMDYMDSF